MWKKTKTFGVTGDIQYKTHNTIITYFTKFMAEYSQPDTYSLRVFGLMWTGLFAIVAAWPLLKGGDARLWAVAMSAAFFVVALAYPKLFSLTRFYQGWVKLGGWIGYVNSRIILVAMFFVIFAPMGILFRIFRRDPLHRKPDLQAKSYFITRESQPGSMHHQF